MRLPSGGAPAGLAHPGVATTGPTGRGDTPPPPPYAAVKRAVKEWRALGASRWVIKNITEGAQIPWERKPSYYRARAYPVAKGDVVFAEAEMVRCVERGYWTELLGADRDKPVVIVNGFVTQAAGKQRFVIDCRHQNQPAFMADRPFKYESLLDLASQLRPDDQLMGWDIKDAYHHVPLREGDKPFFAFQCLGRVFQCNTMPFGLKVAPYIWTKVCRPVVQQLRQEGFRLIVYVDDFGGAPPTLSPGPATKGEVRRAAQRVRELLRRLGLTLHPTKGELDGTTELPLLGFLVDTRRQLFLLQPSRAKKIMGSAGALLAHAKTHKRWVRHSALRSFCGAAVSTHLAVPEARFRLRSLYTALRDHLDRASLRVRLGRQAMQDLLFWTQLTKRAEVGRALWPREPDVVMETDASTLGWGATWDGLVPARGFHSAPRKGLHINLLELGAVRLGLLSFVDFLRQPETIVRLKVDSMVAMHTINALSSRSEAVMNELRRLHAVCKHLGVTLRAEYLPSALNLWADRLSRTRDSTDWSLRVAAFRYLDGLYGPHTIDLFASAENKKCGRYYSKLPAPYSCGVDAMAHSWASENAWANPPFNLIGPVVQKIIRDRATVTLVAPRWRSQPWWPVAVAHCHSHVVLRRQYGVFTNGAPSSAVKAPKWRVVAFRFVRGSVTKCRG